MKKGIYVFVCLLFLCAALCGCGSDGYSGATGNGAKTYSAEENVSLTADDTQDLADQQEGITDAEPSERKLIKNVDLTLETTDFSGLISSVQTSAGQYGGYIEYSDIHGADLRTASLVVRIPVDRLDSFLNDIEGEGNVTGKSESVDDVTLRYIDLEAHLKTLRSEQEALNAMLEKADNISDIITIRDKLTQVEYEIESNQSYLNTLKNSISYSTVSLDIEEIEREGKKSNGGVWGRIGANLYNNTVIVGDILADFFVFVISALPFLFVIGVIVLIAVLCRKAYRKRHPAPPVVGRPYTRQNNENFSHDSSAPGERK